jgi:MFS superfamily sulfate permease-like transporter
MIASNRETRAGEVGIAPMVLAGLLLLWAGVLIGVSFLAAPAKFTAPTLSLPVAMDVGRQEFGTLNLVEAGFAVVTLALAFVVRPSRLVWVGLSLAVLIVAVQGLWLLPVLDARAELIIQEQTPPPAPWHTLYVAIEFAKLAALLLAGGAALRSLARPGGTASRPTSS